jgi:tetratricopeptide (TPR) repeat protein
MLTAFASDKTLAAAGYDTSGGTAGQRLDIAKLHLAGELQAARGEGAQAIATLEEAIRIQDALPYSEPPPFFFPIRQALGAVLIAQGKAKQAEAVYREDLRRYPKNGWSLYGLSQSLAKQGNGAAARYADQGFRNAWTRADVTLKSSRF